MKVTDTCKCGATFTVRSLNRNHAQAAHAVWLNLHAPCRGGQVLPKIRWTEE